MAKPLLSEALWKVIGPVLPPPPKRRFRHPGRKRLDDRRCLCGILFVLKTGIPWEYLPKELGWGSGMTCWRRLRDWQAAGVWEKLHRLLLDRLNDADKIDWERASVDSSSLRSVGAGKKSGPSPTDRACPGSKHHLVVDGGGIPLALSLTPANTADVTQLLPLVDAIPEVRGRVGRPRRRPDQVFGDRAYDSRAHRRALWKRGICPRLAKRRTPHGSGLGVHRWVVEHSHSWFHQHRRLRVRYEWRADIHEAFMSLVAVLICWNHVEAALC